MDAEDVFEEGGCARQQVEEQVPCSADGLPARMLTNRLSSVDGNQIRVRAKVFSWVMGANRRSLAFAHVDNAIVVSDSTARPMPPATKLHCSSSGLCSVSQSRVLA